MTIALVTGANKGIGREIAAQLAERGLTVVLAARSKDRGDKAAAELGLQTVVMDVTDPASVRDAALRIKEDHGRLDVLVNNAGISGDPDRQRPGTADTDLVRTVFETNVFGVITVTEAMLPLLRHSSAPRIVNVSSSVGSLTDQTDPAHYFANMPASVAYASSKAALNMVTVQYAKALGGQGFRINAVTPGPCDTDFTRSLGFNLTRTAADGAAVAVNLATIDDNGPNGAFFDDRGPAPW
ncbi:SDR family NAD(P)-dependent oxidoreductase [Actinomadura rubrisoli]|uniref:SDR family NAD(P)-dependent oxidoreductase n=1 Tax=Actinomadura rubrisoli TaxID=2530368 RepID=A0A4R4ZWJ6_9ACTN|nr:SDR family NAD(P)-dependent oxidoreductase [Actinomadura rubrisoli]TDD63573.1 SDR family NAD(P)-dependent oxidoreductase [Actinomadura rubrisoli]